MEVNYQAPIKPTNNHWHFISFSKKGEQIIMYNEELLELVQLHQQQKQQSKSQADKDADAEYQSLLAQLPPEYSEGEISERFTTQYADVVKYVEQWNCWMHWTG